MKGAALLTEIYDRAIRHVSDEINKPVTEELSDDRMTDDGGGPRRCLKGDSGRKAVAVAGTAADAGSGCFLESCGRTRSVNDISFCAACVDSAPVGQTHSFKHLP